MATSHSESRPWVREQFINLAPVRVLDVGVGEGTYSDLLRAPGQTWVGLEVWEPYVKKYQIDKKYDTLVIQDLREATLPDVDLAIVGDCIEHVTKAEGFEFLARLKKHANAIILVVPLGEYPQGEVDSNPHEAHVSTWFHEDAMRVMNPSAHFIGSVVGGYLWERG